MENMGPVQSILPSLHGSQAGVGDFGSLAGRWVLGAASPQRLIYDLRAQSTGADLRPQKWPETSWGCKLEMFGLLFAWDVSCLLLCFPTLTDWFLAQTNLNMH